MPAPSFSNGLRRVKEASGHDTPTLAAAEAAPIAPKTERANPRAGQVQIAAHFDPAVRKQLSVLGSMQNRDNRDLLAEALNDLFVKYGKAPIAKVYGEDSKSKPRGR